MGETAVLAMEGRYEPFTLGREIEIEIEITRAHALERRRKQKTG